MHVTPTSTTTPDAVVELTRRWYDAEAVGYVERTASYDQFPGLDAELVEFLRSLPDDGGPVLDLGCGGGRDTEFLPRPRARTGRRGLPRRTVPDAPAWWCRGHQHEGRHGPRLATGR
jgi:hypothetical protein